MKGKYKKGKNYRGYKLHNGLGNIDIFAGRNLITTVADKEEAKIYIDLLIEENRYNKKRPC